MADRKTILETGLRMETEAHRYYREHASKVKHPGAAEMLREMAAEEQRHVDLFQAALEGRAPLFGAGAPRPRQDLKIGETLKDVTLTPASGPGDVLVVAIKAEMHAIRAYEDWAREHAGTDLETLLLRLAAEEKAHKYRLEKLYDEEFLRGN